MVASGKARQTVLANIFTVLPSCECVCDGFIMCLNDGVTISVRTAWRIWDLDFASSRRLEIVLFKKEDETTRGQQNPEKSDAMTLMGITPHC